MKCNFKKIMGKILVLIIILAAMFSGSAYAAGNYKWEGLPGLSYYEYNLTNSLLLSTSSKIMSFGGSGYGTNRLYIYDIGTKTWVDKSSSKGFSIWNAPSGAVSNDRAYVMPGHASNFTVYDPDTDTKTTIPQAYIQADAARGNEGTVFSKLGDYGDCESVSSWSSYSNCTLAGSADDYIFGTQSIKITPVGEYAGMTMDITSGVDSTKYYMVTGYIKTNGTASDGAIVSLLDADGSTIGGDTNSFQKPTVWQRVGYKIQPSDFTGKNLSSIKFALITKDEGLVLYTLADGLSVIEISADDYSGQTMDQLMTKYPYRGNNINFLGQCGDVDDVAKWTKYASSNNTLDAMLYGNACVYSSYSGATSNYTGIYMNVTDKIDTTKYYFASGYRYSNTPGTSGTRVALIDGDSTPIGTSAYDATTGNKRAGYKVQPSDFTGKNLTNIYFAAQEYDTNRAGYFYCDGLSLIQITKTEYDSLTVDQLMAKYPFKAVDDTTRENASLTTVKGKIYLIGGLFEGQSSNESTKNTYGNAIWEFDTSANVWTKTSANLRLYGHMAFNVGGKIYIIGGRDDSGATRNQRVLEWTPGTTDFALKSNIPVSVDRVTDSRWKGAVVNGSIYIRNGLNTYVYNPSNDTWDWMEKQDFYDSSKWLTILSGFSFSNNMLNATNMVGTTSILYREDMTDVQITERVQMVNGGTTVYLPFRSSADGKNKYFIEIKADTLRLCKTVGDTGYSTATELKSVTRSIDTTIPHTYNIVLLGNNIGIYEDYKQKILIQDDSYSTGKVGFGTLDTQANLQFMHFLRINENSNITGNELVNNGTFATNISGWTVADSNANILWQNNKLVINEQNLSGGRYATQDISVGDAEAVVLKYKAAAYSLNTTGGLKYSWKNGDTVLTLPVYAESITKNNHSDGWMILSVPQGATTLQLQMCVEGTNPTTGYIEFDDISVKKFAPQLSALMANQSYIGLTSSNADMYQFKGYSSLVSDATFDSISTYWGDTYGLPKGGVSPNEFGINGLQISSDTNLSQTVYLVPNTTYKIAYDMRIGTLKRENTIPALKITYYDSQGAIIAGEDVEVTYDPTYAYARVQVPFYTFTTPSDIAFAKIKPELYDNSKDISATELWTTNPSFTANTTYWTNGGDGTATCSIARDTTEFYSSPASLKITKTSSGNSGNYVYVYNSPMNVRLQKGKWYKVSFAAKASSQCTLYNFTIGGTTGTSYKTYFTSQNIYTSWKTYNVYIMPNQNTNINYFQLYFSPQFSTLNLDSFSVKEASDIELLGNTGFDSDAFGWNSYQNTSSGASITTSRDEVTYDSSPASYKIGCTNAGAASTDISIYSDRFPIEYGFWYKLTFRAKSTQQFTMPSIKLTRDTDGNTNYARIVLGNTPTITTDWQTYTVYFMANSTTAYASIRFNLGGALPAGQTLYIDTLSFQQTEDTITQISNSSFNINANEWSSVVSNGAVVSVSRDTSDYSTAPGSLKISCTNKGATADDIKVVSSETLQISDYRMYRLTFKAKSTLDFTIPYVRLQKLNDFNTNYYHKSSMNLAVTNSWNTYTAYFRTNTSAVDARIVFGLGYEMPVGASLYIDDITFEEVPFHWLGDVELFTSTEFFACDMSLETPKNTTVIDNYLVQGGKVIWAGDTPFETQGLADATKSDWNNNILESQPTNLNNNETVSITTDGIAAGITSTWQSKAPMSSDKVNTSLAEMSAGSAAGYEKNWSVVSPDKFVVRDWVVCGPIEYGNEQDINTDFIGEATIEPFSGMIQNRQILATNLISNGNLADGTSGWSAANSTQSASNNILSNSGNGDQNWCISYYDTNTPIVNGHQYYFTAKLRATNTNCTSIGIEYRGTDIGIEGAANITSQESPVNGTWYTLSDIKTNNAFTGNLSFSVVHRYADAATAKDKVSEVQNVLVFDLTQMFGVGKEPTKGEMDAIIQGTISEYGYFNERIIQLEQSSNQLSTGQNSKIWNTYDYTGDSGDWVDFGELYGYGTGKVAYANAYINSNTAQNVVLRLNTPDSIKVFLNGQPAAISGSTATLSLLKGQNRILLKSESALEEWYVGVQLEKPSEAIPIKSTQNGSSIDNKDIWITNWIVCTGFMPSGGTPINTDYLGNETTITPADGMASNGKTWRNFTSDYSGVTLYSSSAYVSYAYTTIDSSTARQAVFYLYSNSSGVKVWVNGTQIINTTSYNSEITVSLNQGINKILIKVYSTGGAYTRMCERQYIKDWLTLSYFSSSGTDIMQTNYLGVDEATISPAEGMVTNGKTWTEATANGLGQVLNTTGLWAMDYAYTKIYCDTDRKALLTTSLNYYSTIWVNGEYLGRADYTTSLPINLIKGYNTILIKHYNGPLGYVRVYLTTTIAAAEKPTGITVLGNSRVGKLVRLYDNSVDGSNTSVKSNIEAVLNKLDDNKVVYYDTDRPFTGIIKNQEAVKTFFVSKGFKQKKANELKTWILNKMVNNSAGGTVIVFAQENIPDTIVDTHDSNCLLRRYLNAGGKIIWTGEQPLANISTANGNVVLGSNGATNIVGITLKGTTDAATVTLTDNAKNIGVTSVGTWKSTRSISQGQGEIDLALTTAGDAAGWIRNYNPEYPYSGFIRLYDYAMTLSDTEKNNMLKFALYDANSSAVYYDSRYASDWITNSASLKTYMKSKGVAEINADNTNFMKANSYAWKTLLFSQDVIPDTMTRYNESISVNPCNVAVSWVDNSEGETAFVVYANGVKKKTVYSDTVSETGKSYMTVVEGIDANSTLIVKPAYIHYTEIASQRSEGDGLNFYVKEAASKKAGGLRAKTYPDDINLRNTVDLYWEDTSTKELGFDIYIDGEYDQTVDSTTTDSVGQTYTVRYSGLESGRTYQFGVKNKYATQQSAIAVIDVQIPPGPIGTITISERENVSTGWSKEGRGYVVLDWNAVQGANSYGIYLYDGYAYRKVQEVTEPTWDSRQAKVYPTEAELNIYPDNSIPKAQSPFKEAGTGENLRDIPTNLYKKTWGTTDDSKLEYRIKISVINTSGEILYDDNIISFQFDSYTDITVPTGGIIINNDEGTTTDRVINVQISVSDNQSGLNTMEFSENAVTWSPAYPYAPSTNWTLSSGTGAKTLYCRVTDKAGNSAVFSNSIELLMEDDIPTIRVVVNNGNNAVTSTSVVLNIVVTDDITAAGSLNVRFSNNNVTWSNWSSCATTQFPWTLTSGNGRKTVYAQVKDQNENVGSTVVYLSLEPQSSTSKVSIVSANKTTVSVDGVSYPAVKSRIFESNIMAYQDTSEICFSWDGVTWSPWEAANVTASGSGYSTVKKKLNFQGNEGWNELYIKTRNISGVESSIIDQRILIDTKTPTVKLSTAFGSSATSSTQIDIIAEIEDNVSTSFMYSINSGAKTALSDDGKITVTGIQKGKLNLINVRIYDEAGNSTMSTIRIWGL